MSWFNKIGLQYTCSTACCIVVNLSSLQNIKKKTKNKIGDTYNTTAATTSSSPNPPERLERKEEEKREVKSLHCRKHKKKREKTCVFGIVVIRHLRVTLTRRIIEDARQLQMRIYLCACMHVSFNQNVLKPVVVSQKLFPWQLGIDIVIHPIGKRKMRFMGGVPAHSSICLSSIHLFR